MGGYTKEITKKTSETIDLYKGKPTNNKGNMGNSINFDRKV